MEYVEHARLLQGDCSIRVFHTHSHRPPVWFSWRPSQLFPAEPSLSWGWQTVHWLPTDPSLSCKISCLQQIITQRSIHSVVTTDKKDIPVVDWEIFSCKNILWLPEATKIFLLHSWWQLCQLPTNYPPLLFHLLSCNEGSVTHYMLKL